LAKGATDVVLYGGVVLEEVLCLPPVEWVGGFDRLLKVFWVCASPVRLRSGGTVGRGHHLLPVALPVLVSPVAASLGQGGVVVIISSAEVTDSLGFAAEVVLDCLLAGGIPGDNVQELPRRARGLAAKARRKTRS
jgi:hypothetical protein